MFKQPVIVTIAVCLTILGAAHILAGAGPLDPPAGPVSPTGRTLDEIYNAILGGGGGGCGLPGSSFGEVSVSIEGKDAFGAFEFNYAITNTGGIGQVPELSFTKDIGPESIRLAGDALLVRPIPKVVIRLHDLGFIPRYEVTLWTVFVQSLVPTAAEQCDGTYRQLEHVTLGFQRIEIKDLITGERICLDMVTGQAC